MLLQIESLGQQILDKYVTQAEFAKIIDVNRSTVLRVIEKDTRLSDAIAEKDGKILIHLVRGILGWYNKADLRKDRGDHQESKNKSVTINGEKILTIAESNAIDRHYTALTKKVEFFQTTGQLMSAEKFLKEAFDAARTTRDAVLYIPQKSSPEIKSILIDYTKKMLELEILPESKRDQVDKLVMEIRALLKSNLIAALRELSEENLRKRAD